MCATQRALRLGMAVLAGAGPQVAAQAIVRATHSSRAASRLATPFVVYPMLYNSAF